MCILNDILTFIYFVNLIKMVLILRDYPSIVFFSEKNGRDGKRGRWVVYETATRDFVANF